jgi:DNA-binding transcriptional LysR family regulator
MSVAAPGLLVIVGAVVAKPWLQHRGGRFRHRIFVADLSAVRHDLIAIMPQEIAEDTSAQDGLIFLPIEASFVFPDGCLMSLRRSERDPALEHFTHALLGAMHARTE